jgi:hypothetical protein
VWAPGTVKGVSEDENQLNSDATALWNHESAVPLEEIGRDEIPDFRERPTTLSGFYLRQAVDSFGRSGDAQALYGQLYGRSDLDSTQKAVALIDGQRVRMESRLQAVLFSALAAESYVNEFLGGHLTGGDFKAVDRMSPVDRYVVGTRLGAGKEIFQRDRPPIPALRQLFKLRNRLVHPKPGFGPSPTLGPLGDFEANFESGKIADFMTAVAAAGIVLIKRTYGPDHLDLWADVVWFGRETLFDFATESAQLPAVDAEPAAPLLSKLLEARLPRPRT